MNALEQIKRGHLCDVSRPGYYWAQLVIWNSRTPGRRRIDGPILTTPRIVELVVMDQPEGKPRLLCSMLPERIQDWIFLERIVDHPDYRPSTTPLSPHYAELLAGPRSPT